MDAGSGTAAASSVITTSPLPVWKSATRIWSVPASREPPPPVNDGWMPLNGDVLGHERAFIWHRHVMPEDGYPILYRGLLNFTSLNVTER
jgi:hypothetical protein